MKKIIVYIAFILVLCMLPSCTNGKKGSTVMINNKSRTIAASDLLGSFSGLVIENDGLTIKKGETTGVFESDEIDIGSDFSALLLSWSVYTYEGTIEVFASVKKSDDTYSDWYSYGVWSSKKGISASMSTEDDFATMDIDTLMLKNEKCRVLKFKVILTKLSDKAPVLRNISITANVSKGMLTMPEKNEVLLDVPMRKQAIVPEIGGRICSPTSLSMVFDYYGEPHFETVETCNGVYDNAKGIYGNWLFNVAYAGEKGYNAHADMFDAAALAYALSLGVPVVCSIRVKQGQLSDSGYPDYTTAGHLITAVGYKKENNKLYFIINDPAHGEGDERLHILAEELESVWKLGVVYVVSK